MKNVIQSIGQASRIQTECNKQAHIIAEKIKVIQKKMIRGRNSSINRWIELSNEKSRLERIKIRLEERGSKVWFSVTSFQGKYINWKNCHEVDGKMYVGTLELIQEAHKLNPAFN